MSINIHSRLALAAIALAPLSCHTVIAHSPPSPSDGPAADSPGRPDLRRDRAAPDQARDSRLAEKRLADRLPPDKKLVDVLDGIGPTCAEVASAVIAVNCGDQCMPKPCASTLDSDGDGMPDARDPSKSDCNKLLLVEDFTKTPSSTDWTWSSSATPKCGVMELQAGGSLTRKTLVSSSAGGPYLLEAKFTVGKVTNSSNWSIGLTTKNSGHACALWVSLTVTHSQGSTSIRTTCVETTAPGSPARTSTRRTALLSFSSYFPRAPSRYAGS
jgi:hypothetical protein